MYVQMNFYMKVLSNPSARGVGIAGEQVAEWMLRYSGYHVRKANRHEGDLVATDPDSGEIARIEVKTARQGRDGKWRFTLYKKGCTNHRHADYVLLLAALKSGRCIPFLCPVGALNQKQAVITSHPESYGGKLAQFRQKGWLKL